MWKNFPNELEWSIVEKVSVLLKKRQRKRKLRFYLAVKQLPFPVNS
jgi:hypothetical protein